MRGTSLSDAGQLKGFFEKRQEILREGKVFRLFVLLWRLSLYVCLCPLLAVWVLSIAGRGVRAQEERS